MYLTRGATYFITLIQELSFAVSVMKGFILRLMFYLSAFYVVDTFALIIRECYSQNMITKLCSNVSLRVACQQRMLIPLDTLSCPTSELAYV